MFCALCTLARHVRNFYAAFRRLVHHWLYFGAPRDGKPSSLLTRNQLLPPTCIGGCISCSPVISFLPLALLATGRWLSPCAGTSACIPAGWCPCCLLCDCAIMLLAFILHVVGCLVSSLLTHATVMGLVHCCHCAYQAVFPLKGGKGVLCPLGFVNSCPEVLHVYIPSYHRPRTVQIRCKV